MRNALVFVVVAVVALAARTVFAGPPVDRGLPTTGAYAASWADRTNVGSGEYDPLDPIWAQNPSWGPPELAGDTFTMPTGASAYHVGDIRLWLIPGGAPSYSAAFNGIWLMLGPVAANPSFSWTYQPNGPWNGNSEPATGPVLSSNLSLVSTAPTETDVTYPGTSYPLFQLDFPVNLTLTGGASYGFALHPFGNPCNNASGNGESNYIAFLAQVMQGYSSGYPSDSSDGFVQDYFVDGTFCDQFVSPWGGVRPFDTNIQVISAGDANGDGKVDINDLTIVLTNYGQTGMVWSRGDFNGDGKVDINDLTIVLTNYGNTAGSGIMAVPEPASLVLLGISVVALLGCAWRRRKHGE